MASWGRLSPNQASSHPLLQVETTKRAEQVTTILKLARVERDSMRREYFKMAKNYLTCRQRVNYLKSSNSQSTQKCLDNKTQCKILYMLTSWANRQLLPKAAQDT